MGYVSRSEFLTDYQKLCEKHKCYIDTGFRQPLYVMEFQSNIDECFEQTIAKLEEDLG